MGIDLNIRKFFCDDLSAVDRDGSGRRRREKVFFKGEKFKKIFASLKLIPNHDP
tara:strand:+ start:1070 stop:1231 length:162 start_codon:yes stop_codon:yes gene_type:complete